MSVVFQRSDALLTITVGVGRFNYQFDWQFANSASQVRLDIGDDLSVFLVPVELGLLLQVGHLQQQRGHRTGQRGGGRRLVSGRRSISCRWNCEGSAASRGGGVVDATPLIFSPEGSRGHITPEVERIH